MKNLNGHPFVDTEGRELIAALSEEIEELKGGAGGVTDYTVAPGAYDSSGNVGTGADGKSMHTSIIAISDIESAVFASDVPQSSNLFIVYFDENENYATRISRKKYAGDPILTSPEQEQYPYFCVSWYWSEGVDEAALRALLNIQFVEQENVGINNYVKNDMSQYRYAMPKWAGIHPWVAFEGVTDTEVGQNSFDTWYSRFHALMETYSGVGLEEVNMSTDYLAANTDDAVPEAISSLTNGGMYMWHLPAPTTDGSGLSVKHKTPKIVLVSGQHGDETSSIWCVWKLLDALCRNDAEHRAITLLRNFCDIYIVPLANPYGIENFTRVNENGINLNRDYAVKNWVSNSGETGSPTAANSQYSTRCISWWIGQIAPDGLLDLHASFGSSTTESGMFVQWGESPLQAIASLIEENIMDVTPYIRKNLAPKFDGFQHWYGHTAESTAYRKKLGMLSNYAIEQGILSATYEVVRRVQWNDVYILSAADQPAICAMNYHGIVNFVIKFVQMVVETLNSGVEWQTE